MSSDLAFTVSEFVAVLNQTLEYAYPSVVVSGEVANFKVSKNRWVYFDLKDSEASVRFFGTVYQLPGPLEDGMVVAVRGAPRLHPQYGFSVSVQTIRPVGEGSIKKAAKLLEAKLAAEGLFDDERKRTLPYPPTHVGLITSGESAAYRDFIKVISARWGGLRITHIDVQVQGDAAPGQIVSAVRQLNTMSIQPDVVVIIRGGGSAEDLHAFSTEQVARAVAASRVPTIVGIGHEVDVSLAERVADRRASTPSNAAELLVPDRRAVLEVMHSHRNRLVQFLESSLRTSQKELKQLSDTLHDSVGQIIADRRREIDLQKKLLHAYNPSEALARGYALVRKDGHLLTRGSTVRQGDTMTVELTDVSLDVRVIGITPKEEHHGKGSK